MVHASYRRVVVSAPNEDNCPAESQFFVWEK
jgi:hypothetical protein